MNPAKLNIKPLPPSPLANEYPKGIDVQFNPSSYSVSKTVSWDQVAKTTSQKKSATATQSATNRELNAPPLEFGGGGARTLTVQLFFDVTEGGPTADVRTETNKIVKLTRIERNRSPKQQPPVCQVSWGSQSPKGSDFPFTGVVTSLTQNFVLFRSTGEPLRANLTVVFTEFIDPKKDKKETDPDFTTYRVKLGDTLASIAAQVYGDPTRWRWIADANRLDDPRRLTIGARLAIPPKQA